MDYALFLFQFIKVQIRQDLVLDVSAATGDSMLSALVPQAVTPVVHLPRGPTKPLMSTQPSPELVKIRNKTIFFPLTPSGEMSGELQLSVLTDWKNDIHVSFAPTLMGVSL